VKRPEDPMASADDEAKQKEKEVGNQKLKLKTSSKQGFPEPEWRMCTRTLGRMLLTMAFQHRFSWRSY
jgi:hypothetical protein